MAYLREEANKGSIYFSLDRLHISLAAKEDSHIRKDKLHFAPQYWRKPENES